MGVVRKLVGSGADVLVTAEDVSSAWSSVYSVSVLAAACEGGHLEVVKLLIEAGADVDVQGRERRNGPLIAACGSGNAELVQLLVNVGSGSEAGKDGGVWVDGLVKAAGVGPVDVVRVLLDAGVDVDGVGNGSTALIDAVWNGRVDVVRVLVEGGADVNRHVSRVGWMGRTPLMRASRRGLEDVVRVLLEAGADVGVWDDRGDTAMDLARSEGRHGVVEILEEWGGDE